MIKILIADDSDTETMLLKSIFESQPDMQVVGTAKDGHHAIKLTQLLKPDIITMDIEMPVMNGIEATKTLMSDHPIPVVVITSKLNDKKLNAAFRAMESGALSVIEKPTSWNTPQAEEEHKRIVDTVRSMAEIKVVRRRFHLSAHKKIQIKPINNVVNENQLELVAIGSSVGGPQALKVILSEISDDFPVPIVIVQHMTPGFIEGFSRWLNNYTKLKVKCAEEGEILEKGTIYFAPDDRHFMVARQSGRLVVKLHKGKPVSGFYPSVTVLLQSVAKTCGKNAIGIILTGMGSDGAVGLLEMKKAESHTFIQDAKSAVVFGMAGVAQSMGAVDKVIELNQIASYLTELTKSSLPQTT